MYLEFTDSITEEKVSVLKLNILFVESGSDSYGCCLFLREPICGSYRGRKTYYLFTKETYEEIVSKLNK